MFIKQMAKEVSELEGGKVNLSIAQILEVIKCFGIVLWRRREYVKHFFTYSEKVGKKYDKDNQ